MIRPGQGRGALLNPLLMVATTDNSGGDGSYASFGKISSHFGVDEGAKAADDLTAADLGPGGTVPIQRPNGSHRLTLFVEHCVAERPTTSLKGSSEKYVEYYQKLEAAFMERFAQWPQLEIVANPSVENSPYAFMPREDAAQYKLKLNSIESPCYLCEMGATTRKQLREGTMIIDTSDYPPKLMKYPRIGAFEVTYQLCEGRALIGRRLVYSKLMTGRWPAFSGLVKDLANMIQLDLFRKSHAHAEAALSARKEADELATLVIEAEARFNLQLERAELTEQLRAGNDEAEMEAHREFALAQLLRQEYEALHVRQLEAVSAAEVSEGRLAMQRAKKELSEWEASQTKLEQALEDVESLVAEADNNGAYHMRNHAHELRKEAKRELQEVRAANASASKELIEAVHAQLAAAKARLKLSETEAAQAANEPQHVVLKWQAAVEVARESVREAIVRIEDAEAQVVGATADVEFREALSFVLQAKLAQEEVKNAPSGDVEAAEAKAQQLKKRALVELEDARRHMEKGAKEALEAAQARLNKEEEEARKANEALLHAETALYNGRKSAHEAELEAEVKRLRGIAERENRQAVSSQLNLDITRREIEDKRAALELNVCKALGIDEQRRMEEEEQRELDEVVSRERREADIAEALAVRIEKEASSAQRAASVLQYNADSLVRTRGRGHMETLTAVEAVHKALEEAFQVRTRSDEARALADFERFEVEFAELAKEEAVAVSTFNHFVQVSETVDEMRERCRKTLEQAKRASEGGELEMQVRVADAAAEMQETLDELTNQLQGTLDEACRQTDANAIARERIEDQQIASNERAAARSGLLVHDAEDYVEQAKERLALVCEADAAAAAAAAAALASGYPRSALPLHDVNDARLHLEAAEERVLAAHRSSEQALSRLERCREESGKAAVLRRERLSDMASLAAQDAGEVAVVLRAQLQVASAVVALDAEMEDESAATVTRRTVVEHFARKLKAAEQRVLTTNEQVMAAAAALQAAQQRMQLLFAQAFGLQANAAEMTADKAEREAEWAAAHHSSVKKDVERMGYITFEARKRLADAKQTAGLTLVKARKRRAEAVASRERATLAVQQAMTDAGSGNLLQARRDVTDGGASVESEAIATFSLLDKTASGVINLEELCKAVDGLDNVSATSGSASIAAEMMAAMDIDKDNAISRDEWIAYFNATAQNEGTATALSMLKQMDSTAAILEDVRNVPQAECCPALVALSQIVYGVNCTRPHVCVLAADGQAPHHPRKWRRPAGARPQHSDSNSLNRTRTLM